MDLKLIKKLLQEILFQMTLAKNFVDFLPSWSYFS